MSPPRLCWQSTGRQTNVCILDKHGGNRDEKGNKQLTLVVGSSWPQDEQFLLPFFNGHKEMKMVIAPHEIHEEHLAAIEKALERPCKRLSAVRSAEDLKGVDCLIIDCFGLLSSIYRYGEIAYVGRCVKKLLTHRLFYFKMEYPS